MEELKLFSLMMMIMMMMMMITTTVIFIALYLTDKGERIALYKINNNNMH